MQSLRVGVIGVGHLGRHHARVLAGLDGVKLIGVADSRIDQARAVAGPLGVDAFESYETLLDRVDAVSVAVPTTLHREVAGAFLQRGIPTLVEKPLAVDVVQARELVELAERYSIPLAVGHIERFNPVLDVLDGAGVTPRYIQSERLGLYTFRSTDIGVVHDLMIHDLDLLLSIVDSPVARVSAFGVCVFGRKEDVAHARIEFEDGTVADLSASRASLHAVRKMRLWGVEGYVSLDFKAKQGFVVHPSDALRRGVVDIEGLDLGDPEAVKSHLFGKVLETSQVQAEGPEPLGSELGDFVRAIREGTAPRVSGVDALRAMQVADRVVEAIAGHAWNGSGRGPVGPMLWSEGHATPPTPKLFRVARSATRSASRPESS